jgi:hypothetical protein
VNEGREIDVAAARLREIADRLGSGEIAEEEAESLAREAADLLARASAEIDRAVRDASGEGR